MPRCIHCGSLDVWDVLPQDSNLCLLLHQRQDDVAHCANYEVTYTGRLNFIQWQPYELLQSKHWSLETITVRLVPLVDQSLTANGARKVFFQQHAEHRAHLGRLKARLLLNQERSQLWPYLGVLRSVSRQKKATQAALHIRFHYESHTSILSSPLQ